MIFKYKSKSKLKSIFKINKRTHKMNQKSLKSNKRRCETVGSRRQSMTISDVDQRQQLDWFGGALTSHNGVRWPEQWRSSELRR